MFFVWIHFLCLMFDPLWAREKIQRRSEQRSRGNRQCPTLFLHKVKFWKIPMLFPPPWYVPSPDKISWDASEWIVFLLLDSFHSAGCSIHKTKIWISYFVNSKDGEFICRLSLSLHMHIYTSIYHFLCSSLSLILSCNASLMPCLYLFSQKKTIIALQV